MTNMSTTTQSLKTCPIEPRYEVQFLLLTITLKIEYLWALCSGLKELNLGLSAGTTQDQQISRDIHKQDKEKVDEEVPAESWATHHTPGGETQGKRGFG